MRIILLALVIRQEAVLSLLSQKRITNTFMNVFNSVTSPHVFSYHCVMHCFLTIPVGLSEVTGNNLPLFTDNSISNSGLIMKAGTATIFYRCNFMHSNDLSNQITVSCSMLVVTPLFPAGFL